MYGHDISYKYEYIVKNVCMYSLAEHINLVQKASSPATNSTIIAVNSTYLRLWYFKGLKAM